MLTPEQIDAALGNLQQQIDEMRADLRPEPEPAAPNQCTTCGNAPAYWRWRKPWVSSHYVCDGCFRATAPDTHPDPAVAQLHGAVKQAGERLVALEALAIVFRSHATDGVDCEHCGKHHPLVVCAHCMDFIRDDFRICPNCNQAIHGHHWEGRNIIVGYCPGLLADGSTKTRLSALEDSAHTPVENDLSRIQELEQIHADGTPPEGSVGHDFLCDRLDAIEKRIAALEDTETLTSEYTPAIFTGTVAADFPPIAGQEQVAAAYADRYSGQTRPDTDAVTDTLYGDHIAHHNATGQPWGTTHDHHNARLNGLLMHSHIRPIVPSHAD